MHAFRAVGATVSIGEKRRLIARLDDAPLVAQIASIGAERDRLRAEFEENQSILDADVENRRIQWSAERRGFASEPVQLGITLQETRTTLETDKHTLESLKIAWQSQRELLNVGATGTIAVGAAKELYEAMAAKIRENDKLIVQLEGEKPEACKRNAAFSTLQPSHPSVDKSREQMEQAIRVQDGLILQLEAQRAHYVLRAPFDGVVVDVKRNANEEETFRPGEGVCRGPGDSDFRYCRKCAE